MNNHNNNYDGTIGGDINHLHTNRRLFFTFLRRKKAWLVVISVLLIISLYMLVLPVQVTNKKEHIRIDLPEFNWLTYGNKSILKKCRNSVQGPKLITDELGYVCPLSMVDPTGCCNTDYAVRFDCSSCHQSVCCGLYEHCVSCCLNSDKKPILEKVLLHSAKSLQPLFSSVKDQFELCLAKCRTSSQSVYHENSYRNENMKYCYGLELEYINTW